MKIVEKLAINGNSKFVISRKLAINATRKFSTVSVLFGVAVLDGVTPFTLAFLCTALVSGLMFDFFLLGLLSFSSSLIWKFH